MKNKYYPHLAEPITINGVTFKNRVFGAPMSSPEMDPDSHMRKEEIAFHENRARGGLSACAIGLGIVDAIGRTHTKEVTLYDIMSLPSLKEVTNAMHRHNCMAVMELAHGGKHSGARAHEGAEAPVVLGVDDCINPAGLQVKAMTEEEILHAADAFGSAAALCKEAGFDMVLIHGGHGWLVNQFFSPMTNHRTDRWGGSFENRMRFPLLVIEKVREAVGPNFPIEFRMSGSELVEGGYGIEEGIELAKAIDGLVDIIHVSAGIHEDDIAFTITHPSMFIEHGCNVKYAAEIKKHVKTPVATLGGLNDPDEMEEIIASGKADIIEVARQSLADPFFCEKAFTGRKEDITKCCRCYTCFFNYLTNRTYCCAFNPVIGNELENKFAFAPTSAKKVAVIGGGVGGMEAAITAAGRGHDVTLYEKDARLGGQLLSEEFIPFKADMHHFVKVLERRLADAGVKVEMESEMTPEKLEALGVDAAIVAIGAEPVVPPVGNIDDAKVVGLDALKCEQPQVGDKVVILGGGLVGMETAIYLDTLGKDVTVVEMRDEWAPDAYFMHKNAMRWYMQNDNGLKIKTSTTAKAVVDEGLLCVDGQGNEIVIEADSILLAAGFRANREAVDAFYNAAPLVYQVGDCIKAGRVVDAVTQGYYRALDL